MKVFLKKYISQNQNLIKALVDIQCLIPLSSQRTNHTLDFIEYWLPMNLLYR